MLGLDVVEPALESARRTLNPLRQWPVDVAQIASRLGLEILVKRSSEKSGSAYLLIQNPPAIVLIKSGAMSAALTRRDSFSIAHEIAHWIIWLKFNEAPSTRAEYWHHEHACNVFANRLLVDPDKLTAFLLNRAASIEDTLWYPTLVSRSARVTWEVAAKAISASVGYSPLAYVLLQSRSTKGNDHRHRIEVASSSIRGSKPNTFIAVGAICERPVFVAWLNSLKMSQSTATFPAKVATRRVSIELGALTLDDVRCAAVRVGRGWILHFNLNDQGVRIIER